MTCQSWQKTIYKFKSINGHRGPKKGGSLEQRRGEMKPIIEAILSPTYQAPSNPAFIRNTLVSLASYASLLEERLSKDANPSQDTPSPSSTQEAETPVLCGIAHYWDSPTIQSETPRVAHLADLTEGMGDVTLSEAPVRTRFFGPSSNSCLMKAALDIGTDCPINTADAPDNFGLLKFKRPFFWRVHKVGKVNRYIRTSTERLISGILHRPKQNPRIASQSRTCSITSFRFISKWSIILCQCSTDPASSGRLKQGFTTQMHRSQSVSWPCVRLLRDTRTIAVH